MRLLTYAGNAGDRNPRGMAGARDLGAAIAARTDTVPDAIGSPRPLVAGGWARQLAWALPDLTLLASALGACLDRDGRAAITMGRCAAAIATLPQVARRYPDAAILWFDAHGDCNAPGGIPHATCGISAEWS